MNGKFLAAALIFSGVVSGISTASAAEHSESYPNVVEKIKSFDPEKKADIGDFVKSCYHLDASIASGCKKKIDLWHEKYKNDMSSVIDRYVAVTEASLSVYLAMKEAQLHFSDGKDPLKDTWKYTSEISDALIETEPKGFFASFFK